MSIYLLLLLSAVIALVSSFEGKCYQKFPLHETSTIMKTLVKTFAKTKNETDEDGTLWMNRIFIQAKQGYEVDGITYYLNTNELPPENTFYFDAQRFLSVPVFVIPSNMEPTWRPAYPDRTYELSKISFECPQKSRACGLKCCPNENKEVIEKISDLLLSTPEKSSFEYRSRSYSFSDSSLNCSYHLSFYDNVQGPRDDTKKVVYFQCPDNYECCGLSCIESSNMERLRAARSYSIEGVSGVLLSTLRENLRLILCVGIIIVAVMLLIRVIFALCTINKTKSIKSPKRITLQREESVCTKCRLTEETRLSEEV